MTKRSHASFRHVWIVAAACSLLAGSSSAAAPELQQFDAYLLQGYREMVEVAARKPGNAELASHFAERSAMAARAGPIEPEALEGRQLDSWTLREAGFARRQLVARLEEGARQRQPLLAAIAQVNFDCWVAASPRRAGPPDADECRRRFYFAFAGLAPADQPVPTPSAVPAASTGPEVRAAAPASPVMTVEPLPPPQPRAPAPPSPKAGTLATAAPGSAAPPPQAIQQQPTQQWAASGSRAAICGPTGPNCETPVFTGPAADALIYDLREVGADRQSGTGAAGAGLGNSNARSAVGAGGSAIGGNNGNSGSGGATTSANSGSGSAGSGSGGSSPSGSGTATGGAQSTGSTASGTSTGGAQSSGSTASGATGGAQSTGSTATGTATGGSQSTGSTSSGTGGVSGAVNNATDAAASAVNDATNAVDTAVHDVGNAVSGALHDLGKKLAK